MTAVPDVQGSARRSSLVWASILASIVVVLSLGYPLVAPVFAIAGGVVGYRFARRSGSVWAWTLVAVSAAVLAVSLVIDLGLLAATTVQTPGVRHVSGA